MWSYIRLNYVTFLCLTLGTGLIALYGYGSYSWIPAMLIRRYGWTQAKTGLVFGVIVAFAGTLGIVSGGRLADWLRQRGFPDSDLRVALGGAIAGLPFVVLFPLASSANWAAGLLVAGRVLHEHAVWRRPGRDSTDDAQYDALRPLHFIFS